LAASIFHYQEVSINQVKAELKANSIEIRTQI